MAGKGHHYAIVLHRLGDGAALLDVLYAFWSYFTFSGAYHRQQGHDLVGLVAPHLGRSELGIGDSLACR